MTRTKLVWSDDPKDQSQLAPPKTAKSRADSIEVPSFTAIFRLEKTGRGGKTVTIVDRLPNHETFARDLCRELKSKCGSGGTFVAVEGGYAIEIQGDKRDAIKKILTAKGISFRGM